MPSGSFSPREKKKIKIAATGKRGVSWRPRKTLGRIQTSGDEFRKFLESHGAWGAEESWAPVAPSGGRGKPSGKEFSDWELFIILFLGGGERGAGVFVSTFVCALEGLVLAGLGRREGARGGGR